MTKKTVLLVLAFIMMSVASVNAQVIIGGNGTDDPHAGAVLDLSPLGKQKLGLLLPGVELTNDAADFVLGDGEVSGEEKTAATGMLVYNTADVLTGPGLYVWDGAKWQALMPPPSAMDAEGNKYSVGYFGDAGWWMTENLRSTKYSDGTGLTATSNAGIDASLKYYWYPSGNKTTFDNNPTYGLLYTWAAATDRTGVTGNEESSSHGPHQGICPAGWHLPSDLEWTQLTDVISASADGAYSTTTGTGNIGTKMKSETTVDDQATNGTSNSRTANGFDALLVGRMFSGSVANYGTYTLFWSSSSNSSTNAWYRYLYYDNTGVTRSSSNKCYMYSVRCKKNDN
jgi:uncharacterized protein (TIGR02145 family)